MPERFEPDDCNSFRIGCKHRPSHLLPITESVPVITESVPVILFSSASFLAAGLNDPADLWAETPVAETAKADVLREWSLSHLGPR
jgi:hypothetical protein